jgi:hypothetical protein
MKQIRKVRLKEIITQINKYGDREGEKRRNKNEGRKTKKK